MSPGWRGCGSNHAQHGDINNESERAGAIDGHGGGQTTGTDAGAGGRADGGGLPPKQAHLAAVSGCWGCGVGASTARPGQRAAQAGCAPGAGAGALRGGALRGLRPDIDGGASGQGRSGGGSRDGEAVAADQREADRAPPQASASAMAGTQAVLWGDGATGRLAPRLV